MINAQRFVPLVIFIILCWFGPALLYYFFGPLIGFAGAGVAAVVWYRRFRFPSADQEKSDYWFVFSGYIVIGIILIKCISRLIGGNLF